MSKYTPVTGITSECKYFEHEDRAWFKGFCLRSQTTIRFRPHHLELLQRIAVGMPLYLSRKMDLTRWEFGHAGVLIRSMARIQLRNQLIECNADPVGFEEYQTQGNDLEDVFASCMQSALRCEVTLDLDRLRDTTLDILIMPREDLVKILEQDAEFCKDDQKTIEDWKNTNVLLDTSHVNTV